MADVRDSSAARFVLNGVLAAVVHFVTLRLCLQVVGVPSAGISNTMAALAGTTASFFGNRHFVFRSSQAAAWPQFVRFWMLYGGLSLVQGIWLFGWTDVAGLDYRIGFVLGLALQIAGAYFGGRHWVFKSPS